MAKGLTHRQCANYSAYAGYRIRSARCTTCRIGAGVRKYGTGAHAAEAAIKAAGMNPVRPAMTAQFLLSAFRARLISLFCEIFHVQTRLNAPESLVLSWRVE